MANVILVFGSTTGNTEMLAEHVVAGLEEGMASVTVKNVTEASVDELADNDAIVFGCSTWGEGDLQERGGRYARRNAEKMRCGNCRRRIQG